MLSLFQAVCYAIIHSLTELLPIGSPAALFLARSVLDWPEPQAWTLGAMYLGVALSVFFYFIHDWASLFSAVFQILLLGRKPSSIDERLALFYVLAALPLVVILAFFRDLLELVPLTAVSAAVGMVVFSLIFWRSEKTNRKTRNLFNLGFLDCALVAFFQGLWFIPGSSVLLGSMTALFLRNIHREVAFKFCLMALLPIQLGLIWTLPDPIRSGDFSWLYFLVTLVVSLFVGILTINSFQKVMRLGTFRGVFTFRVLIALGFVSLAIFYH